MKLIIYVSIKTYSYLIFTENVQERFETDSIFGAEGSSFFIRLLFMNNITLDLR